MARIEEKSPLGYTIVKWTDAYGTEIKKGSLITYCVRTSCGTKHYKARVTRTDSKYIYVDVNDNSWWRSHCGLPSIRKARLYATHNIIVYAQPHTGLMLDANNNWHSIKALVV